MGARYCGGSIAISLASIIGLIAVIFIPRKIFVNKSVNAKKVFSLAVSFVLVVALFQDTLGVIKPFGQLFYYLLITLFTRVWHRYFISRLPERHFSAGILASRLADVNNRTHLSELSDPAWKTTLVMICHQGLANLLKRAWPIFVNKLINLHTSF